MLRVDLDINDEERYQRDKSIFEYDFYEPLFSDNHLINQYQEEEWTEFEGARCVLFFDKTRRVDNDEDTAPVRMYLICQHKDLPEKPIAFMRYFEPKSLSRSEGTLFMRLSTVGD